MKFPLPLNLAEVSSFQEVIPKYSRHFMPWALLVKPSGLPPKDPYTQMFLSLIVVLPFNRFWIQLLGHASQAISGFWPSLRAPDS